MGALERPHHTLVAAKLLLLATLAGPALPAVAGSLPAMPEDSRPVLGVGSGPSLSIDWRIAERLTVGASTGMTLFDSAAAGVVRYDLRGMYLLRDGGATKVTLSAVAGVWGDTSFMRQPVEGVPVGIEAGMALAYPFLPQLIGRINFVAGYQFFSSPLGVNPAYLPPAAGLEIAYYPLPSLELTVGYNGQGDIVGLRWHI